MRTVLLATGNPAKQAKLRWLLDGLAVLLVTPDEIGLDFDAPETAGTHRAVAAEKAVAWSERAPHAVIASDGGAHVPALGDAWTSVRTRRAAGAGATDADRADHLLGLMRGRAGADRDVVWREAVAVAEGGRLLGCWEAEGRLGRLVEAYDPAEIAGGFWMAGLLTVPRFDKLYRDLTDEELAQVDDAWNTLRAHVRAWFAAHPTGADGEPGCESPGTG